jgi:methylamine dehydrogenase accessory protein MauD
VVTHKELEGKPTILAFISPNCGACKDLIPEWNQCCIKYQKMLNFVLMGVGERGKMEEFVNNREILGKILWDRRNQFLHDFRVRVTPFAFILDEKGVVRGKGLCNGKKHIEGLLEELERNTQANAG